VRLGRRRSVSRVRSRRILHRGRNRVLSTFRVCTRRVMRSVGFRGELGWGSGSVTGIRHLVFGGRRMRCMGVRMLSLDWRFLGRRGRGGEIRTIFRFALFGTFGVQVMIKWRTLVVAGIATFEEKRSRRFRRRDASERVILLKPTTSVSDVRMG